MDGCIFCKIIDGKIPCAKIWEDDQFFAFADIAPIKTGHTLVLPKEHISYIFDMDQKSLSDLMEACKPIATALIKTYKPKTNRIGVIVAGEGVSHVHIHLIPMDHGADLNLTNAEHNLPFGEILKTAKQIKELLVQN